MPTTPTDKFLTEVIAIPGIAGEHINRRDCFAAFIAVGHDKATADMFAFGVPAAINATAHPNAVTALKAAMLDDFDGMRAALHGAAA